MILKSVFVTKRDLKYCKWCHSPIPRDRAKNSVYCSKQCGDNARNAYQRLYYKKKKINELEGYVDKESRKSADEFLNFVESVNK